MLLVRSHALALALLFGAAACTVDAKPGQDIDASSSGGIDAASGDHDASEALDAASNGVDAAPDDAAPEDDCPRIRVTADSGLNIREEANTSSDILGALANGTVVTVLERVQGETVSGESEWFQIEYDGIVGFVTGAFSECTTAALSGFAPLPAPADPVG